MRRLTTLLAIATMAMVLATSATTAWAAHGSEVWLFQVGYMPTQTAGSIPGPTQTFLSDSSVYTDAVQVQDYMASGIAMADMGKLYTAYNNHMSVSGGIARTNLGGNIYTWFKDTITVLPGDSGLNIGDQVQIVFYSGLVGQMTNPGYASGSSCVDFLPQLLKGSTVLAQDQLASPGIYGPNGYDVDYMHQKIVSCKIGDVLVLQASLHNTINGSGVTQGSDVVFSHNFCGTTRVGYADGFNDILLQSEVGATVVPEPSSLLAMLSILGPAGMVLRRRSA